MLFTWLQDKWRNLSVSTSSHGSKEKSRAPKIKAVAAAQHGNIQNSAPVALLHYKASSDAVMDDPPNSLQDGKNAPRYVFSYVACHFFLINEIVLQLYMLASQFLPRYQEGGKRIIPRVLCWKKKIFIFKMLLSQSGI